MNNKWFWYSGITAVLFYIFAVAAGGILFPGYSHVSQDVSQLTSTNSPVREFMSVLFIYNFLVAVFGMGLFKLSKKRTSRTGSFFIIAIGILGIVIAWFPINTRGTEITFVGIIHIVLVSIISLLTVASGFLFWTAYRKSNFKIIARISLATGIGFLITGPVAAVFVLSPYAGLLERIPIGLFLLWIVIVCLVLLKSKHTLKFEE